MNKEEVKNAIKCFDININTKYMFGGTAYCPRATAKQLLDTINALEKTTAILEKQGQDILDKHKGLLLPRHIEYKLKDIALAVGEAKKALGEEQN